MYNEQLQESLAPVYLQFLPGEQIVACYLTGQTDSLGELLIMDLYRENKWICDPGDSRYSYLNWSNNNAPMLCIREDFQPYVGMIAQANLTWHTIGAYRQFESNANIGGFVYIDRYFAYTRTDESLYAGDEEAVAGYVYEVVVVDFATLVPRVVLCSNVNGFNLCGITQNGCVLFIWQNTQPAKEYRGDNYAVAISF